MVTMTVVWVLLTMDGIRGPYELEHMPSKEVCMEKAKNVPWTSVKRCILLEIKK